MTDEILTIADVEKYLKLSKPTLYFLAQRGKIPASKVGKHWRFRRSEIDTWLKEHQVAYNRNKQNNGA